MKSELFLGALRFTPFWLFLDGVLLVHFFASWIYSFYKTGWKVDFFHLTLLQALIIPVFLIYPFNGSEINMLTLGPDNFLSADPYIDYAFCITLIGYMGIRFGAILLHICEIKLFCDRLFSIFRPLATCITKNIESKNSLLFLFYLTVFLTFIITYISSLQDYFLRPRAYFQINELTRPIYNATISIAPILISFLSIRYLQYKERWVKSLLIISFFMSLFYGIRSVFITGLISLFAYKAYKNKGSFNFKKGVLFSCIIVIIALEIEKIREGDFINLFYFSFNYLTSIFSVLAYGNHLSDTRDFAWVLSCWDQEYLYGLGYLANLLSFIPSSLLEFRQIYSLSPYTSNLIGLDTSIHSGVRPGYFGQLFFNFGPIGVFLGGLCMGLALKSADLELRTSIDSKNNIIEGYAKTIPYLCITTLLIAPLYWQFYLFILMNLLCTLLRKFSYSKLYQ